MNETEVREIVNDAILPMRAALRLDEWDIQTHYRKLEDGVPAESRWDQVYRDAYLSFDPGEIESKAEVLKYLRHELLHLATGEVGPFLSAASALTSGRGEQALLDEAFRGCVERLVGNLERLLDLHGMTPGRLVAAGRRLR